MTLSDTALALQDVLPSKVQAKYDIICLVTGTYIFEPGSVTFQSSCAGVKVDNSYYQPLRS